MFHGAAEHACNTATSICIVRQETKISFILKLYLPLPITLPFNE